MSFYLDSEVLGHILLSFSAVSAVLFAAIQAGLLFWKRYLLKKHLALALDSHLPSMEKIERTLFQSIRFGFFLYYRHLSNRPYPVQTTARSLFLKNGCHTPCLGAPWHPTHRASSFWVPWRQNTHPHCPWVMLINDELFPIEYPMDFLEHFNFTSPSTHLLLGLLVIAFFFSAFFSAGETAMMSINRYRLRHKAEKEPTAKLLLTLLKRPDRLLGVLLIGNTVINSIISSIATVIALRLLSDYGVLLATATTTLCLLVFVEVAPKTLAALYPEKIAYPFAKPLRFFLILMHPVIIVVNILSNAFLWILGVRITQSTTEKLSGAELRSIVSDQESHLPHKHRSMFLGILDLEQVSLNDIMIPRNEIIGINVEHSWEAIVNQLAHSQHTFLPVYREDIDNIVGILHLKNVIHLLVEDRKKLDQNFLIDCLDEPYFVPIATNVTTQLVNFQKTLRRVALVVNEYGDIQGLVTLEDILEEIVGNFTTEATHLHQQVYPQEDHSYLVDGSANLRELNQSMGWRFSTKGPKTLSGLIIQHLENIPEVGTCMLLSQYPVEVIAVKDNTVKTARISKRLKKTIRKEAKNPQKST